MKIFELFAGIGAPRKALDNLGIAYESLGYSEIDKAAIKSYCAIHGDTEENNYGDITKITDPPKEIDLLIGGFPCQDISRAGNVAGIVDGETRSGLMFDMMRFIEKTHPSVIVTENVKDFTNKRNREQYNCYVDFLQTQGYYVDTYMLDSSSFGVPQKRERVFIIANMFNFIQLPQPRFLRPLHEFIDIVDDSVTFHNIPQATKKGYIVLKTPGLCNLSHPNSKTRRGRVIEHGILCPTIMTSNEIYLQEATSKRKLTAKELLLLMGFDKEDYKKASTFCSDRQIEKQAGNSIVVPVLEAIFKEIYKKEER